VEWFKVKALSSNPSTAKKKKETSLEYLVRHFLTLPPEKIPKP
jgi:hypothetical protein